MTRDIKKLAKDAGFTVVEDIWVGEVRVTDKVETLIAMVEAAVRQECAGACYARASAWKENAARAARICGDAIKAMK